jgi:hypothetical protein
MLASEVDDRITSQINAMSPELWSKVKVSVLPPVKNGRYVFRNAAMAGIFLSPQEDVQLRAVINGSDVPKSTEFWIALRTNGKGETVSAVPLIPTQVSPYVSYFDGDGRLIFLKEDNVCTTANPGDCLPYNTVSDGPVILQHARTRFGAAVVDPATVKEEFAAICFNPTDKNFFKSNGKTKVQSDAIGLCMRENGIFVAPVRPLQWIASLKAVKKIFNQLPFPMYSKDETLAAGVAWTSLISKAGKYEQILPAKPADTCLFDKEFKAISFDVKNQTPAPMYHLKREGNKLVLASGEMPEGSSEQWVVNEDDFMSLSLEILNKKPENIQFKECAKPLPGVCGSANGVAVATAPTVNLCAEGTASSVTGFGPWEWKCQSAGSSPAASCSAPKSEGLSITQGACKTYTKTWKDRPLGNEKFLSCDPDKKIKCWGTGNGRNWSWKDIENGCESWEGSANYGSPGCACECTSCPATSKSEVAASSSCPTPPEKVYTNTISRFGGRYAGTYDDYRGGGFNGVSTSSSINRLCSDADSNWIGAGGEVAGVNYQCLASSAPTRSFHNGGRIDSNGGNGQGWCQSTAVEWVKCKCK